MTEFLSGFVTSALLCSLGFLLGKICNGREQIKESEPEYMVMSKDQYDYMKNNPDVKKIIIEQPQMPPLYSEKDNDLIVMKLPPLIQVI
jgi:hypothetical protein